MYTLPLLAPLVLICMYRGWSVWGFVRVRSGDRSRVRSRVRSRAPLVYASTLNWFMYIGLVGIGGRAKVSVSGVRSGTRVRSGTGLRVRPVQVLFPSDLMGVFWTFSVGSWSA
jgi:hypothetical protein